MNRSLSNAIALSLGIAALAIVGCGKDKKDATEASKKAPAPGTEATGAQGTGVAAAGDGSGPSKATLGLFPPDGNLVVGVNFRAVRGTPIWNKYMPLLKQQQGEEFQKLETACGIDPLNALDTVTVGATLSDSDSPIVAIRGNLAKAKVLECAKKVSEGKKVDIAEDGQFATLTEPSGEQMTLAWLDDGTVVTGGKARGAGGKDWLKSVLSRSGSIRDNAEFMGLLSATNQNDGIWFAVVPPAGQIPLGMMGASPKAVFGSVNFSGGLKIDAGMRFSTPEEAKALSDKINETMGPMKADPKFGVYMNKTTVSTAASDVLINLNLNQAEFDTLIQDLQTQLPALMMLFGGRM